MKEKEYDIIVHSDSVHMAQKVEEYQQKYGWEPVGGVSVAQGDRGMVYALLVSRDKHEDCPCWRCSNEREREVQDDIVDDKQEEKRVPELQALRR